MVDHEVSLQITVTGGNEFSSLLDRIAGPLQTLQERVEATAASFTKFSAALPNNTKLSALNKLSDIFESFSKLPSANVLKSRADSLEDLGRALSTLSVSGGGDRAKQLQEIAIGVATLGQASKSVTPSSAKKVQQLVDAAVGTQFSKLDPEKVKTAGQAIKDFGLDLAAIDPKQATNLNKFSVGIKNIIKLLDTDLPGEDKLKKLSTVGRDISDALRPLTRLGELKIGPGIQQTVGGIAAMLNALKEMDITKVSTARLETVKDVAYDLADILTVFSSIPRPKSLNMIGGAVSGIVGAINIVSTMDVSASQLYGKWEAIANVGRYVATALKQFDGVKRPENLAFVGTAVRGIIDAADAVNTKKVDVNLIDKKWFKLIVAAKYVAVAMGRFSGIRVPAGIEHMGTAIKSVIELVAYANRSTVGSGDVIKNWIKIELASTLMSRALKKFDKIERPENIQAAGYAVRAISEIMREIGELPKNAISGLRFWQQSVAKDLGGIIRKMASAFKSTNKIDPAKVNATAEAIRAIASLLQAMPTATSELDEGTVTTWRRLDEFFDEVAKGFKKLAKIKIPTNLGNLAIGLKHLADMGGDFSAIERSMKGMGGGGAFGIFQGLVDSVVNTVTFVPRKINELAVKLIPGLGKVESLLSNMFSSGALGGAASKILSSAFKLGGDIAEKIANGIKGGIGFVTSALGKITGAFTSILSGARNFGNQLASQFNTVGNSLLQISRTAMQVGQQLLNSPLSLNRVLKSQGLETVASYESVMKQIEVLGGVQGGQLSTVNDFLLQLGADSVFSAGQAAEAFLDLSKSGLSVADSMASLPAMMDLAAAGNISIADSASLVINAVGAYGKSFDDTTDIVNSFAAAANISTAEVADLATGFSYAAPSAAAFGVDMDTLNAALALMTDRGLEASKAGTGLRALISQFMAPTDAAKGAMDELGLSFYDAQGNARDFEEVLADIGRVVKEGNLDTGFDPFTEEARNALLDAIGGSANATSALLTLLDTTEDGQLTLEAYAEAMKESASAADIGSALMDTFKGSVEAFQGSVETLLIKALTPLINHFLRPMVDLGTDVVNFFSSLPSPILSVATALFGVVSAGITLAGSLSILTAIMTGPLGGALIGIGGALFSILNPLKLIAMVAVSGVFSGALLAGAVALSPVLVAIGAAFYDIYNAVRSAAAAPHIEQLRSSVSRLQEAVMGLYRPFKRVGGFILQFLFGGSGDSTEGSKRTQDAVIGIIDTITGFVDSLYGSVMDLRDIGYGFSQFFDILEAVGRGGDELGNLESRWKRLFSFLSGNSIAEALIGDDFSLEQMKMFFAKFYEGMSNIRNIITSVVGAFGNFVTSILEGENIGRALGTLFSDIGKAVDFKRILDTVVGGLVSAASTVGNAALLGIGELIDWALPSDFDFSVLFDSIRTGIAVAATGAEAVFTLATSGLVDARSGWLEYFLANKDDISAKIKTGLSLVLLNLGELGIDLVDMIGIPGFNADDAKEKWAGLTADISEALGTVITDAIGVVLGTDDEGIAAAFDSLKTSVSGFIDSIVKAAEPITDVLARNVDVLFTSIKEAFTAISGIDTGALGELFDKFAAPALETALIALGGFFAIMFEVDIAIINGFISMVPPFVEFLNAILNRDIKGAAIALGDMFTALVGGITDMVNSLDERILKVAADNLYKFLDSLPDVAVPDSWLDSIDEFLGRDKEVTAALQEADKLLSQANFATRGTLVDPQDLAAFDIALSKIEELASADLDPSNARLWLEAFDSIAGEVGAVPIDRIERLQGVLDLLQDTQPGDAAYFEMTGLTDADIVMLQEYVGLLQELEKPPTTVNPFAGLANVDPAAIAQVEGLLGNMLDYSSRTSREAPADPVLDLSAALRDFRDADAAAYAQDLTDAFGGLGNLDTSFLSDLAASLFGEGNIAEGLGDVVTQAQAASEVDWSSLSSSITENAPLITDGLAVIDEAFGMVKDGVTLLFSSVQSYLPLIRTAFDTNVTAIMNKLNDLGLSFQTALGGLLTFRLVVQTQLPAIRQIWTTEFQLMGQAVANLLTPLGQVAGAVGGMSIGGVSMNTGSFPEKRAKGGPVMKDRLYEVGEDQKSELLNINGRSYLIPGANGNVVPAESGRAAAGKVPGVQAAGEQVSGNTMTDPLSTIAEVLRHIEAMTAQIEINTSIHSIPDWFNKYWNEYVNGMWVKTIEKLWTQLESIRGAVGSAAAGGGGGGGGYGGGTGAASSGSSGGGTGGSAGGAAPTSRSAAGQSSWWGEVTKEKPFGDKFHAPTGTTEFVDFTANKGGMYAPTTTTKRYDPLSSIRVGGSYAFGGDRLSRAAARVGENGKPELFSLGGRQYLIPGAAGGSITPLKEFGVGPGMQNVRGMGYNNVGKQMTYVEGDINVTVQATTGASAQEIASQARDQVAAAQQQNRQRVSTTLRAAGRL